MLETIITSLITIAEKDLESAVLLYDNGNYYNSLFFFQQAIEKAYKASALLTRQIGLSELKYVGHDYIKLLKKCIKDGFAGTQHALDPIFFNMVAEDVDISKDDIESTMSTIKRDAFFNLTETDLDFFLKLIENQQEYLKTAFTTMIGNPDFIKQISNSGQLNQSDIEALSQSSPQDQDKDEMLVMINHVFTLNILGLITSPHSEQARYPFYNHSDATVSCPTEIYNQNMPVIKHQVKLMKMAEHAINYLKNGL